ncbi:hypothetical protein [Viridibacillus arvi]|uniref:hypothetical protein n=1 Tax=Viridibacillus arvi TaxID=263475 RepID=UPI0034CE689E
MKEVQGNLAYTLLNKMVSLRICNCLYNYCDRCDIVTFSDELRERVKKEVLNAKVSSNVVINL